MNEETRMLVASAERLIAADYDFHRRQSLIREAGTGTVLAKWPEFSDLGWTALALPEALGGYGDASDLLHLVRTLARGLVMEPVASVALAAQVLSRLHAITTLDEIMAGVLTGSVRPIVALAAADSGYAPTFSGLVAQNNNERWQLSGGRSLVLDAPAATHFMVSATIDGRDNALFLVPADSVGVQLSSVSGTDDRRLGTLRLNDVNLPRSALLARGTPATALVEFAGDLATTLHCADALGAMEMLLDLTVEYASQRKQFGRAIGSFQALQHKMADMFMAVERGRSMFALLAESLTGDDTAVDFRRRVSMAKVEISDGATLVGQHAIQIHGGIGTTDELAAAHYFKRLTAAAVYGGDSRYHLGRYLSLR
mgnify:CR=1 FL=1